MERIAQVLAPAALLGLAWLSSGCTYTGGQFGSLAGPFPGERVIVGCLDVAIDRHTDGVITGAAAKYSFGNRCDAAVVVDFTAVVATGMTASGAVVPLRAYDPAGVLAPHALDGRRFGSEIIEYQSTEGVIALSHLCLDVSRLETRANSAAPVSVCLPVGGEAALATSAQLATVATPAATGAATVDGGGQ